MPGGPGSHSGESAPHRVSVAAHRDGGFLGLFKDVGDGEIAQERQEGLAAIGADIGVHRLGEIERRIFEARRLADDPITLEELSAEFGVSRERVRQIEVRAFEKVQKAVRKGAKELERPRAQIEAATG